MHVGAYVQQQPLIDAVVNETWVETLGMTADNALLVRTGAPAPATVAKEIRKLFGDAASVTLVDKATRIGLQPGATQIAVVTGTVADAVGVFRYTVLGGGHIAPDPAWVRDAHHHRGGADPRLGDLQQADLPAAQGGARRRSIERGLADKIHPDAVRRLLLPAVHRRHHRRSPTTPSAWPSTSTRSRTSAAPSG